jgi:hypothetical protein
MRDLYITATDTTPEVLLSFDSSLFRIKGKSIPLDGESFYKDIIAWFDGYVENAHERTVLDIHLENMNISSSKMILFILYRLKELKTQGKEVLVNWGHLADDKEMIEVAEDYEFMVDIPFKLNAFDLALSI